MDEEEGSPRGSPRAHRKRAVTIRKSDMPFERNGDHALISEKLRNRGESNRNGPMSVYDRNHEATRRVSSGGSSDGLADVNGPLVSGSSSTAGSYRSGGGYSSGKSDSLTRGMKPNYGGYQLRRHGSSESMSSQSTLVNRSGYDAEDDPQQSITDLIGMGRSGLTRSQINAHMKSEAKKHRHRYHGERGGGGGGGGVVGGIGGGVLREGGESGGGGVGERVVYYQRLHPELQFPFNEKVEKKKRSSRRHHEVHGADTPEDDEGRDIL